MSTTDFSLFTQQAHAEKVEQAVKEILLDDATLSSFTENRIEVLADPTAFASKERPCIFVYAVSQSDLFQLNNETEQVLPVEIALIYDERRDTVGLADRTFKSAVAHIVKVLLANSRLEGTTVSAPALVDRIREFQTVPFEVIPEGDVGATILIEMIAVYEYLLNIATGLKA